MPLGPPQRLGAEAVVPEPDALAHLSFPQHVEAPRVHHLRELVGVVQAVQRIEGGRVVGEALRHPLVAVVPPPVDPGAPPLVRHLVGPEHLRLSRVHVAEGLVRQEQQAGKGLPAQGLGLGDEQRRVGERSEVLGEELDGAGDVGDGPLPAVRREPAVVGVGVDGDGGGLRALDLGHLELAVVEGHAADRPVRRPALGAGVVLDALVEQGPPAGDAVPLGHPEGRLEAAGAVVGVLRPPVQGVEEHEVAGLAEPIDERPFVGELEDERLAGGDGARQRHRHPGLEVVVLEGPFLALLREGQRLAGQRRRFRGVRVGVGGAGGEQARAGRPIGRSGAPPGVGHLQHHADPQPEPPRRNQRLDQQGRGRADVAVPVEGHVDLGARHPRPRRPDLVVGGDGPRGQPQGRAGRLVVVEGVRVDRERLEGAVRVIGPVVGQGVEAHPVVGHPAPVVVAVQDHLFRVVGLDHEGQPAVVLAVELDEPIGAAGRQRARFPPPQVVEDPALGVEVPLFQQPAPPVPQPPVGALGVAAALAGGGGEGTKPLGGVVARPQDETVEGLVDLMLVREPLELVVLDRVGGVAAQPAIADEDRGRYRAADLGGEIQASFLQLELEAVHPKAAAANLPRVGDLRLAQLLIQGRGTRPLLVRVLRGTCPGRCGRRHPEGDEGRARQHRCGAPEPGSHRASLSPATAGRPSLRLAGPAASVSAGIPGRGATRGPPRHAGVAPASPAVKQSE